MPQLFIGTSGWSYPHWRGPFYPEDLGEGKWLEYYTQYFNSVELNVTFYRLVKEATFRNWHERTPKGFSFVAKGSRFITHIKRLNEVAKPLRLFVERAAGLKGKLVALLWQLPPQYKKDLARLERFLGELAKTGHRQVFEFRNGTWFDTETYELLRAHNACLCIAHSNQFPCVREVTADFLYLRFHGGTSLYGSNYSENELREWAHFARSSGCATIFAFFNNDAYAYAVKNARTFEDLLGQ
jgi:uncharacterized protein YecE (DUF72 family)